MDMSLGEKVSYLKGLLDGMDNKDKVTALMADILYDMALQIEDQQDQIDEICEAFDELADDFDELEEDYYHFDEDDFDDDDDLDDESDYSDDDLGDFDDDFDDFDDSDEEMYETTCPTCGNTIYLNEELLKEGSVSCPECSELLEFDLEDTDEE